MKKFAAFGVSSFLLLAPLVSFADAFSDLQANIAVMMGQIRTMQTQVSGTAPADPNQDLGTENTDTGIRCPDLSRTLQRGSSDTTTGGQVTQLQNFLTGYYHLDAGSVAGGYFGTLTQNLVVRFQQEHGLTPRGLVGAQTRAVIASVCGTAIPVTPFATVSSATAAVDPYGPFTSGTFTITGSAQNVATVVVALVPYPGYQGSMTFNIINSSAGAANGVFVGTASVSNGRWLESFSAIPDGMYTLMVYDLTTHLILSSSGSVTVDSAQSLFNTPVPPQCPVFQLLQCDGGIYVQSGTDANGCQLAPQCITPAVTSAPSLPSIYPIVLSTCTLGGHTSTIADAKSCIAWCSRLRALGVESTVSTSCIFKSPSGESTIVASAAQVDLANALTAIEAILKEIVTLKQ